MSRPAIAVPLGLLGFFAYIAFAMILADHVLGLHWILQIIYFLLAGTLWAWPAHKLILWAGGK
jgi:Protein of unknown function (DUF2842)